MPPTRSPHERVMLAVAGIMALAAAMAGAWWLWSQSGAGGAVRDESPGWAPDGRVIFASRTDGQAELSVADRSGGQRRQLTTATGEIGGPAYSPDGSLIAFHSNRDGNFEIYVMRADGAAAATRLTADPSADRAPAWSRDGRQIVFLSDRANPLFDLYRMNVDGTGVERLTTAGANGVPQYSPEGNQVAFDIDRDVYVMSLSTRGLRRLTHTPSDGVHPTWSPDGTRIAFSTRRNGRSEIFVSRADGSEPRMVVTMPRGDAIEPRWSPDGQSIAFVHAPDGADSGQPPSGQRIVYVTEIATGSLTRISR